MISHRVYLSDGTSYTADLVVYCDWVESQGHWRLFWLKPGTTIGVQEQSTVTGKPFFYLMRDAIAYGIKRYGIKAYRVQF